MLFNSPGIVNFCCGLTAATRHGNGAYEIRFCQEEVEG